MQLSRPRIIIVSQIPSPVSFPVIETRTAIISPVNSSPKKLASLREHLSTFSIFQGHACSNVTAYHVMSITSGWGRNFVFILRLARFFGFRDQIGWDIDCPIVKHHVGVLETVQTIRAMSTLKTALETYFVLAIPRHSNTSRWVFVSNGTKPGHSILSHVGLLPPPLPLSAVPAVRSVVPVWHRG